MPFPDRRWRSGRERAEQKAFRSSAHRLVDGAARPRPPAYPADVPPRPALTPVFDTGRPGLVFRVMGGYPLLRLRLLRLHTGRRRQAAGGRPWDGEITVAVTPAHDTSYRRAIETIHRAPVGLLVAAVKEHLRPALPPPRRNGGTDLTNHSNKGKKIMRDRYAVLIASALLLASASACVPVGETPGSLYQQCEDGDAYACREWRKHEARERAEREQARRAALRAEEARREAIREHREVRQQEERREHLAGERQQAVQQPPHHAAPQPAPVRAAPSQPKPASPQKAPPPAPSGDKDKDKKRHDQHDSGATK